MSNSQRRTTVRMSLIGVLVVSLVCQGCATFVPGRLPSTSVYDYSNRQTQYGVSVAVDSMDERRARAIFDAPLLRRGVQPIFIVIDNGSDRVYAFAKSAVDGAYLPAEQAARAAYRHTALRTGGLALLAAPFAVFTGMLAIVLWPLYWPFGAIAGLATATTASTPVMEGVRSSQVNREMLAMFVRHEIPDSRLGPGHSLAGFLFVPRSHQRQILVPLIDVATGGVLTFEFDS